MKIVIDSYLYYEGALKGIIPSGFKFHNFKNMTNDIQFPNLTSNFYHVFSIFIPPSTTSTRYSFHLGCDR